MQEVMELRSDTLPDSRGETLPAEDRIRSRSIESSPRPAMPSQKTDLQQYDRIILEFRNQCLEELGLEDHPRGEAAFDLAWEMSGGDLGQAHKLMEQIAELMVPNNPVTGWLDVAWVIQAAANRSESRKSRHAAIKAAIADLVQALWDEDDEDC